MLFRVLLLAIAVAFGAPDTAQAQILSGSRTHATDGNTSDAPPKAGARILVPDKTRSDRRDRRDWRDRRHRRHRPHRIIVYDYDRYYDRDDRPPPEPAPPEPEPAPPEPEAPAILDPAGHARPVLARGVADDGPPVTVGEPLPAGLPIVILDPVRFGLPRPPRGEIYARAAGEVIRLDATTRVVAAIIPPSPPEPTGQ